MLSLVAQLILLRKTLASDSPDKDVSLILFDIQARLWQVAAPEIKILMDDVHVKISISPFFASFLP